MRVAVTGATGFVGRWLCRRLVERGDEVTALVRPGADVSVLPSEVVRVEGALDDRAALARALDGAEVVQHLAGIRRASTREDFFEVNAEGTRRVVETLARAERPARLVLTSSIAATGPAREERPLVESDPLRPFEWYGESKAAAEAIVRGSGLPWSIARPTRILGPGDKENLPFFKLAARGWKLELLGPPRPISMVDVSDVVDGLLLLGEREAALGEAFFLSGAAVTLGGLQDLGAEALGRRLRRLPVPPALLWGLAAGGDLVGNALGRRFVLNRKLARQLTAPSWDCAIDKARTRLGYAPKVPVADAVRASVRWYRDEGLL